MTDLKEPQARQGVTRPTRVFYKFEGETPVPCETREEWLKWYATAGKARIVAEDEVGGLRVSTFFRGSFFDGAANLG
jgi:hypothetical protein